MAEKLSNEQSHERIFCAFTHIRVAWGFVALCALEVFVTWRNLGKPEVRPEAFEIAFYILFGALYFRAFFGMFRCLGERLIIGIPAARLALSVVVWFWPGLIDRMGDLPNRIFLGAWAAAFLISLRMPVQAMRNPYTGPGVKSTRMGRAVGMFILFIAGLFVVGALIYWLPLPK